MYASRLAHWVQRPLSVLLVSLFLFQNGAAPLLQLLPAPDSQAGQSGSDLSRSQDGVAEAAVMPAEDAQGEPAFTPSPNSPVEKHPTGTTTRNPDGTYTTRAQARPVYGLDPDSGDWKPFDNTLRTLTPERARPGFAYESTFNAFQATFADPSQAPGGKLLRFAVAEAAVSLTAVGAQPAAVTVEGAQVTYRDAYPGIDLRYTVDGERLKEDVIIAQASALEGLRATDGAIVAAYELALEGVTATQTEDGRVVFTDAQGVGQFALLRPFMVDSRAERAARSNAIAVTVTPLEAGKLRLELRPDATWLQDPARVFPVIIDPSFVTIKYQPTGAASQDTYILSDGTGTPNVDSNTNFDGATTLTAMKVAGANLADAHALMQFNDLSALPKDAIVSSAKLGLVGTAASTTANVKVFHNTSPWQANIETWNTFSASSKYDATPDTTSGNIPASTAVTFDVTAIVRKMVKDTVLNYGFRIIADTSGGLSIMHSSAATTSTDRPYLELTYAVPSRYGLDQRWQFVSQDFGGGTTGQINVTTGNLAVRHAVSAVPARGLDVAIVYTYNSQDAYGSDGESGTTNGHIYGAGWTHSYNIRLIETDSGNLVRIKDGDGQYRDYGKLADLPLGAPTQRIYDRPIYFDYTLTKDLTSPPANSNYVWALTSDVGQITYGFEASGTLRRIKDRNGNELTISYSGLSQIQTITDAASRTATFVYNTSGADNGRLQQITDMAGRVVTFEYDSGGKGLLKKITHAATDPGNAVTEFGYDAANQMVSVKNPENHTSTVAYQSLGGFDGGSAAGWIARPDCGAKTTAAHNTNTAFALGGSGGSLKVDFTGMTCGGVRKPVIEDYASLVTAPAGYWRLGEASGATADDASTNNRDGTYENTPLLAQTGALPLDANTAVKFDGSDYVNVTPFTPLDGASAFSVEAWVKLASTATTEKYVAWRNGQFDLRVATGSIAFSVATDSLHVFRPAAVTVTPDVWQHIVGVYGGGVQAVYLDGVLIGSEVRTGAVATGSGALQLAGASSGGSLVGSLDDVAVYGRVLGDDEIAAHYWVSRGVGALATTRSEMVGYVYLPTGEPTNLTAGLYLLNGDGASVTGPNFTLTPGGWNRLYWPDAPIDPVKKVQYQGVFFAAGSPPYTNTNSLYVDSVFVRGMTAQTKDPLTNIVADLAYTPSAHATAVRWPDQNNVLQPRVVVANEFSWVTRTLDTFGNRTDITVNGDGLVTAVTPPPAGALSGSYNYAYASGTSYRLTTTDPALEVARRGVDTANGNQRYAIEPKQEYLRTTSQPFTKAVYTRDTAGNITDVKSNLYPAAADVELLDCTGSCVTQSAASVTYYGTTGLVKTATDALSNVTTYLYDGLDITGTPTKGYLTQIIAPPYASGGATRDTTIVRNTDGSVQKSTDPSGRVTEYVYDDLARVKTVKHTTTGNTATVIASTTYDLNGRVASRTDGEGRITRYAYNAAGRLTTVKDALWSAGLPNDHVTEYEYYPNGLRKNQKVPYTGTSKRVTTYTYDQQDRLVTVTDPLGNVTTSTYDARGNLTRRLDALDVATDYTYNVRNELVTVDYPDSGIVAFEYDRTGRRTLMEETALNLSQSYTYDSQGRTTRVGQTVGSLLQNVDYAYDAAGNLTTLTYPDSKTATYTYYAGNFMKSVAATWLHTGDNTVTYAYDAAGRPTTMTYPNGTTAAYAYDDATHDKTGRFLTQVENKLMNDN